jgi:multiple sugar transport system substrate-binding protein
MRKVVLLMLVISMLLIASAAMAQVTTITYGYWMSEQQPGIEAQIAAFEKAYPNIKVKAELVPWADYWVKLQSMLAAGTCWDVLTMDNGEYLKDFASKGILLDIAPLVKRDNIDLSLYPEALVKMGEYNGHLYSLPRDYDTEAIIYNKDMFDKAGIEYPNWNWTWTDVVLAAQKLTIKNSKGNTIQYGITSEGGGLNNEQCMIYPLMFSNGVPINKEGVVEYDTPQAQAVMNSLYTLTKDGYAPSPSLPTSSSDLFYAGKAAMSFEGSWMVNYYAANIGKSFKWGIAPFPVMGIRANISDSLGDDIWAGSPNKEAAWTFVKFLESQQGEDILAKTGVVIPAIKGAAQLWVDYYTNLYGPEFGKEAQIYVDQVKYTTGYPCSYGEVQWNSNVTTYGYELKMLAGQISIADGCAQEYKQVMQVVAENTPQSQ